ncbi:PH domain-containing 4 isoform X1 [Brachionus plicatilis]|uniref:PH domain-containing 4 isoform X1 n=1 Tax=Brachionus plicatilis TaxID=10195 RepID=A0A3M7RBP8_BRAPC|nr:PH domain-containing 4 isoform X1 [Brachionus plicatilis]
MSNTLQNLIDMSFESEDATDSLSDADPQFIQKLSLYLSKNESLPNDAEQQASLSHHNEQEPPPQENDKTEFDPSIFDRSSELLSDSRASGITRITRYFLPRSSRRSEFFKDWSNKSELDTSMINESALDRFGSIFGPDQSSKLTFTNHTYLNSEVKCIAGPVTSVPPSNTEDIDSDQKKRNKIDEYYNLEVKQANLIKLLANSVLARLNEENEKLCLCDADEIGKVFTIISELKQAALLVHDSVSDLIRHRLTHEWHTKPYFGDILIKYYRYYKIYKAVLSKYPNVQINLATLMKKKNFASTLKKLLDAQAQSLENVNRLDMLFDRLVDFPRRIIQLLESYAKLLNQNTQEFCHIKEIMGLFNEIFESSNQDLNRMVNFQLCYEIQYMFDPPLMTIVDHNRELVKQGPIYKVAKRDGDMLLRHLALFTDILLVCHCDRIKRKLVLKYRIETKTIKLVEHSNQSDELMFRIITSDQNNEFKADKLKDKEEWMKAFKKVKNITSTKFDEIVFTPNKDQIGVVPPVWIKDSAQTTCSGCNENFSAFKRRHHCRTCGKLFCHACCSMFIPVQFNEYQKTVRVCNECYTPLKRQYERHVSLGTLVPSPTSPSMFNQIINTVWSKSSKNLSEIEAKEPEENKIDLIDLNELFRPTYEKQSRKAIRCSSSSRSNKTNSFHENDSFSSFTDEEIVKSVKEPEPMIERQNVEITPKPPLPPKPRQKNATNSKIFTKREPVCQEYGFLKKIQINKDLEAENLPSPSKTEKWERVYFVFYSDSTIGICLNPEEIYAPRLVIPLNHYSLKNLEENSFGLDKILMDVTNLFDSQQSLGLNAKRNIFELNYEIMFQNKDLK